MNVEVFINGTTLTERNTQSGLEKILYQTVSQRLEEHVGHMKCRDHGGDFRIIAIGNSLNSLRFEVKGCCHRFIEKVQSKLS